jgi:hypothetical protein
MKNCSAIDEAGVAAGEPEVLLVDLVNLEIGATRNPL